MIPPAQAQFLNLDTDFDTLGDLRELLRDPRSLTNTEIGYVSLDGRHLFQVAAPVAEITEGDPPVLTPLEQRVRAIEGSLRRFLSTDFDPNQLEVTVSLDRQTNQPILNLNEQYLMTVTSLDAELQGQQANTWAIELTTIIETALIRAHAERQPQFLLRQTGHAAGLLGVTSLLSWLLGGWGNRMHKRRQGLREARLAIAQENQAQMQAAASADQPVDPILVEQQAQRQKQENRLDGQQRLLQVGQTLLWSSSLLVVVGLFPQSRWIQTVFWVSLRGPLLKIIAVTIGTYGVVRISSLLTDQFFAALHQGEWFQAIPTTIPSYRLTKRIATFSGVIKGVATTTVVLIGGILGIALLGVNVGPLLASLGFIGLGISLAAQDLIKDVINGLLILMEDQFAEGDVIVVDGRGGLVEHLNLRITQLRNTEGSLITIPNSSIKVVENLSNGWSRVDLGIQISYQTDVDQALLVIRRVAQEMSRDWQWRDQILDVDVLGVDQFAEHGMIIRLWIKVQPLQQWPVAREYRRRLKRALDQAGIPIPLPQQAVWFQNHLDLKGLSEADLQQLLALAQNRQGSQIS
ncbi:MAG: mechanosensitive ion channel family protein [Cyanobacteriota bacterium]|nr:mechanosensitive ion channel family protein [Cyanobacteriota bacterium]